MARRLFDILAASLGLLLAAPLLLLAALGIRLSSRGPVLYRSLRVGRGGGVFTMLKLRTMHADQRGRHSKITGHNDPRVFPFGRFLRKAKIDELPQLLNVLAGDMSIVGPRPEEPVFVARHYAPEHRETLSVRPGLASPGSIYNYTHGERLLDGADPEQHYLSRVLPVKLALDRVYVQQRSFLFDLRVIGRTIDVIVAAMLGRDDFPDPPEMAEAQRLTVAARRWDRNSVPVDADARSMVLRFPPPAGTTMGSVLP